MMMDDIEDDQQHQHRQHDQYHPPPPGQATTTTTTKMMMVNNNNHNNYNYNDNSTNHHRHVLDLIQEQIKSSWNTTTTTPTNDTTASLSSTTTTKFHVLNVTEDIRNYFSLTNNHDDIDLDNHLTTGHDFGELVTFLNQSVSTSVSINSFDFSSASSTSFTTATTTATATSTTTTTTTEAAAAAISTWWWEHWINHKPFPSGYSQLSIVLLAIFLSCIIILVVVGNLLVCIAIATEKSLKPVQNWFIASLAVSDLLIGLIIMPFSLARELMGYWMFGQVWCDIHAALDVLLCTASINSLFLISLDRYWSITQAVKYLKKRTPSRAAMMIAFVWIFSAFVSLPPLVGLKKTEQSNEYPQCNLSDDPAYVLYSSIGSFYFPALMMVFVYAKIFIAARSRARKHIAKKRFKIPGNISGGNNTNNNGNNNNNNNSNNNNNNNDTLREKSTTTTLCTSFSNPSPPEKNINIIINNTTTTNSSSIRTGNRDVEAADVGVVVVDDDDVVADVVDVDDDYGDSNETKDGHECELKAPQILMLDPPHHHHHSHLHLQHPHVHYPHPHHHHHHSPIQIMPEELEFQMECKRISVDVVEKIYDHPHHPHHPHHDDDDADADAEEDDEDAETVKMLKSYHASNIIQAVTPQIIIETSAAAAAASESRRQSWNIISTSEIISTMNINNPNPNPNPNSNLNLNPNGTNGSKSMEGGATVATATAAAAAASQGGGVVVDVNDEKGVVSNDVTEHGTKRSSGGTLFSKAKYKHFKFKAPKINALRMLTTTGGKSGSSASANDNNDNNNNNNNNNTTIDDDSDTADSPTNKDSGTGCETKSFLSAPKLLRSRFGSTMSIADYDDSDAIDDEHNNTNNGNNNDGDGANGGKGGGGGGGGGKPKMKTTTTKTTTKAKTTKNAHAKNRVQYQDQQLIHLPSDAERHKRKIAKARERRATLIVGLIMAAFITAWLPFFVLYVLVALCQKCKETIPEGVFAVAFWLGYGNSAANPIIYTIFNRDYRRAFRKILFKR